MSRSSCSLPVSSSLALHHEQCSISTCYATIATTIYISLECLEPPKKYVTLFWTNFDPPPPVTHCHTFRDPLKYVTHLGTPQFLVVHTYIYVFTGGFVLVRRGFCRGILPGFFCLEGFIPCSLLKLKKWFLSVHHLSEYIRYNRKLNITFNFRHRRKLWGAARARAPQ